MKHLILGSSGQIGSALTQWCDANSIQFTEFDVVRDPAEDLRIEKNERLNEGLADADFVMFLAYDVGGHATSAANRISSSSSPTMRPSWNTLFAR